TRNVDVPAEIRRNHAVRIGALAADAVTRAEAKPEIVLTQRAGGAGERVDVAADRPAIADKRLIEVLSVVQPLAADRAPHLEVAPGLVDAGGRNPVRHR